MVAHSSLLEVPYGTFEGHHSDPVEGQSLSGFVHRATTYVAGLHAYRGVVDGWCIWSLTDVSVQML